jgi:structural maintenance of chromosome 1
VQEFEDQFIRRSEGLRENKLELETRQSRLTSQVKYEQSKDRIATVTRFEKRIADQNVRLDMAEKNLDNLQSKRLEMQDRTKKLKDQIQDIMVKYNEKNNALNEARKVFSTDTEGIGRREKAISQMKTQIDELLGRRSRILTDCKVERIRIPLAGGGDIGGSQRAANRASGDGDDGEDDNDDEVDEDEMRDVEDEDAETESMAVNPNVKVDYVKLSRRQRSRSSPNAQREAVAEMEEAFKKMEGTLENLAPNMRAKEHMMDVSMRLAELDREADEAKERAKRAGDEFESIKEDRQDRFNSCFTHVADKISEVYKQLTRSVNYPMGGTAYLSVEQQEEPYLSGVKFNAMPPTKRFRDMDQLSGGERTLAALALLFAIHDYKPSPFFILDEVDAALDTGNVSKVSSYVRSRAPELQTIVITHKDAFFEKADALIGIYRDSAANASRMLTLDLTRFDEPTGGIIGTGIQGVTPAVPAQQEAHIQAELSSAAG